MRWNRMWGLLTLLLVLTVGCKQRGWLTEADLNSTTTSLVENLEQKPDLVSQPLIPPVPPPPTLDDLDRNRRFISLAECIALALERGRVGQPSLLFPGTTLDNLVQFTGQGVSGSDAIRVLALDPARTGANIEAALSKFDAALSTSMTWTTTDQPIGTSLQSFQAGNNQNITATMQQSATFNTTLVKPLATGGLAGITFNVPYTNTNLPARVNPAYAPSLQFQFEQPLLQGFGVEINQLRASHPGSVLNPGLLNGTPTNEGILITRLRFDQSRAEFERQLNQMLLNVEVAYWNLYGAYWTLYSREQGLRFAYESFRQNKATFEAGRTNAADFHQARGSYEQFRAQRLQTMDQLLEYERNLRALVGLPIEDGNRLMPSDSPTLAPYKPDWGLAHNDALSKRPELYMARQDVKAAQLQLILAKNSLLPDLRFTATYDDNSLGNRLDGSSGPGVGQGNAFRNLADGKFHNWSTGIRLVVPLGYRLAYTQMRQAQLNVSRSLEVLSEQEAKAQNFLALYYRRLSLNYKQIQANRATREAFGEQLRVRNFEYNAGRGLLAPLLDAQRAWADALNNEFQSIVAYNNAMAGFEYGKGTIQEHNNVHISEGALHNTAYVRAVEHQKQRTAALVLRERAAPTEITPLSAPASTAVNANAPSLPAAMAARPPLQDAPELPANLDELKTTTLAPVERKPEDLFPPATPVQSATPPGLTQPTRLPSLPPAPPRRTTEFGSQRLGN